MERVETPCVGGVCKYVLIARAKLLWLSRWAIHQRGGKHPVTCRDIALQAVFMEACTVLTIFRAEVASDDRNDYGIVAGGQCLGALKAGICLARRRYFAERRKWLSNAKR